LAQKLLKPRKAGARSCHSRHVDEWMNAIQHDAIPGPAMFTALFALKISDQFQVSMIPGKGRLPNCAMLFACHSAAKISENRTAVNPYYYGLDASNRAVIKRQE